MTVYIDPVQIKSSHRDRMNCRHQYTSVVITQFDRVERQNNGYGFFLRDDHGILEVFSDGGTMDKRCTVKKIFR